MLVILVGFDQSKNLNCSSWKGQRNVVYPVYRELAMLLFPRAPIVVSLKLLVTKRP